MSQLITNENFLLLLLFAICDVASKCCWGGRPLLNGANVTLNLLPTSLGYIYRFYDIACRQIEGKLCEQHIIEFESIATQYTALYIYKLATSAAATATMTTTQQQHP